jgi:hypothetical protein
MYRASQDRESDSESKSKDTGSSPTGIKKRANGDTAEKAGAPAIVAANGTTPAKVPLLFSMPVLGLLAQEAEKETSPDGKDHAEPGADASAQASDDGGSSVVSQVPQAAAMAPRTGGLAFSIHLVGASPIPKSAPAAAPAAAPVKSPTPAPAPVPNPASRDAKASALPRDTAENRTTDFGKEIQKSAAPEAAPAAHEASAVSLLETQQAAPRLESNEPVTRTTPGLAVHDVQPIAPESPKPAAGTEILLQLGGKDQASAAVRLVDRAGTVNVSVHTPDADLRNSLRSNISELTSQLNAQGIRAEVAKPVAAAAHMEHSPQDSRQDQQASSGRQQSFTQGEREQQRDQKSNSSRWMDEFEEESTGEAGNSGGTNR